MPFKKGESGNPGGRPKEDPEVRNLARSHGPAAIARLAELMTGDDPRVAVSAAQVLLDRGFGKPHQSMDIGHHDVPAEDMTDDELLRIAARGRERTVRKTGSKAKPEKVH